MGPSTFTIPIPCLWIHILGVSLGQTFNGRRGTACILEVCTSLCIDIFAVCLFHSYSEELIPCYVACVHVREQFRLIKRLKRCVG